MSTSNSRKYRALIGLIPAALALTAMLPAATSHGAPQQQTQTATSSPKTGSDLSAYVPHGELHLTAAERASLDARAERTLRNSKAGGKRVAPDTIVWENEGAILTLDVNGARRTPRAAAAEDGTVRLYEHANFKGRELTFVKCKFQKLRWYDFTNEVSSWKNQQTGGADSFLHYWDGSNVQLLDHLDPGKAGNWEYSNHPLNDRADFLTVCK